MNKTNAQRIADFKARRKAEGLKALTLWCHPDDVAELKRLALLMSARRERLAKRAAAAGPA